MTTNLTNAPKQQKTEAAGAGLDEQLLPLLQEMLIGVRHHRETALLAGFNGQAIVTAALCSLSTCAPPTTLSRLQDIDTVNTVLNMVVLRTIRDNSDHHPNFPVGSHHMRQAIITDASTGDQDHELVAQWLASWLENFCKFINEIHPQAIEVVILRGEGCDNRRIAHRLGLTHRLVKRIVIEIYRSFIGAKE